MLVPVLMLVPTNVCLLLVVSVHNTDYDGLAVLLDKHLFCFTAAAQCIFFHGSRQLTKPA